jgi:hypothetical protein
MMDSAGVFILFLSVTFSSNLLEVETQEFETHAMCKYAARELTDLYESDGYTRVKAVCLPKEENTIEGAN